MIRLKPLFNSFQGCFRDDCRCFAGLYLLYRILIVALLIILGPTARFYAIFTFLIALFLSIHCVVQPYQSSWHNVIDALLFVNLLLICNTSVYTLTIVFGVEQVMNHSIQWAQVVLICIPIICCLIYFIYQSIKKIKNVSPDPPVESSGNDWPARLLLSEESMDSDVIDV